jgi:TatD DNase family protein
VILTDTHCHLDFNHYQADLDAVLDRSRAAGVERILVPGIDVISSRKVITLIERDPLLYGAVGVHPNSGNTWQKDTLTTLGKLASSPRVVALGEIGLDYYRDRTPRDEQKRILQQQLSLALELQLPVVLHVRNQSEEDRTCIEDLLALLEEWIRDWRSSVEDRSQPPGVIHSFSGNVPESHQALQMGFYLGITGPVTYKNADTMRDVVKAAPLDRLLIETDGPFLSPQAKRGKRNEPAHVCFIVDKISEIIQEPAERVAAQTTANAATLFKWE